MKRLGAREFAGAIAGKDPAFDWCDFGLGLRGGAAYCVAKAALNAVTVKLAQCAPRGAGVKVNSVSPGWVRTRMGGRDGKRIPW